MKDLWIPVNIPRFSEVQQELLNMVKIQSGVTKTFAFSVDESAMITNCPLFMNWLIPRKKKKVRLYRFYVTEPYGHLGAHIDGIKKLKVPFGLNIPVANCQNTFHVFYDCKEDNFETEFREGYLGGCTPKDHSLLNEISRLEITSPYFTRNDVMHAIENNNPTYRVMFTVRWQLHPELSRTIEEVFDFGV